MINCTFLQETCVLRENILDLADKFQSAQGWASERVLSDWMHRQEWRNCLPRIFSFTMKRATGPFVFRFILQHCTDFFQISGNLFCAYVFWQANSSQLFTEFFQRIEFACISSRLCLKASLNGPEANGGEASRMDSIQLGIFLPHEIVSSFYHFRQGDLFYSLLTGTPAVSKLTLANFLRYPCSSSILQFFLCCRD